MSRRSRAAALLALEQRLRTRIATQMRRLLRRLTAFFARAVRRAAITSGLALLGIPDIFNVLKSLLDAAKTYLIAIIRAAYLGGAAIGRKAALDELKRLGHEGGPELKLGRNLDDLTADCDRAFAQAMSDLQTGITEAYDGVQGAQAGAARVLTTQSAIQRSVRRLGGRVDATGVYATYQGATDAQLGAYQHYTIINPAIRLEKTWIAEPDACDECRDLHGTTLPVAGIFTSAKAYGALTGPPLHPNCRCELTLSG